jgi:hypothetical protein
VQNRPQLQSSIEQRFMVLQILCFMGRSPSFMRVPHFGLPFSSGFCRPPNLSAISKKMPNQCNADRYALRVREPSASEQD